MKSQQKIRLTKLVKEFNVSIDRILSFLYEKGYNDINPNSKISFDIYEQLLEKYLLTDHTISSILLNK